MREFMTASLLCPTLKNIKRVPSGPTKVRTHIADLPALPGAGGHLHLFVHLRREEGRHLTAETKGDATTIDYDVKNNGRGPTIAESIKLDAAGLPTEWTVKGTTTFGSKIAEHFIRKGARGEWVDSTGKGHSTINSPILYLAQSSSPWANGIYARALLKAGNKLPALPGGAVRLEKARPYPCRERAAPASDAL